MRDLLPSFRPPRRFFLGTAGIYLVFISAMFSALWLDAPREMSTPLWGALLSAGAFFIFALLLSISLEPAGVSGTVVLVCIILEIAMATGLGLFVHWFWESAGAGLPTSLGSLVRALAGVQELTRSDSFLAAFFGHMFGHALFEEIIKFAPVMLLIILKQIRNPRAAMLCGALCGLVFGVLEANLYAYTEYAIAPTAAATYVSRFFIMVPLHGIWTAIIAGLTFTFSGKIAHNRAPALLGAFFLALLLGCALHALHNSSQSIVGPVTQIPSIFAMLFLFYALARSSWRSDDAAALQPLERSFILRTFVRVAACAIALAAGSLLLFELIERLTMRE